MAAKKKDTVTLPRGIRPHRSGYIVDVTVGGKRRTKTAATLEAALLAREALRNAASATSNSAGAGDDTSRDDWTLEQATERTMQVVWAGKPAYKTMLINTKAVLGFFGADTPVQDITLDDIDRFVAHLLNERGNSGGTVNRKLSCLSRILRTAFERGKLEKMPKMPKRREAEHRIRFLSPEEEARMLTILEATATQDVQDAILCLLYTGFRCGELWRLECRDIDLERGTLTAWKTKNHHPARSPSWAGYVPSSSAGCRPVAGREGCSPWAATTGCVARGTSSAITWGWMMTHSSFPICSATHAPPACHRRGCPCPSSKSGWGTRA